MYFLYTQGYTKNTLTLFNESEIYNSGKEYIEAA